MVTSWPELGLALPTSAKDDLYHARDGPDMKRSNIEGTPVLAIA
jgi:hypothetical protein